MAESMAEIVTELQCRKILLLLDPNFSLLTYEVNQHNERSTRGLTGEHYKLRIKYEHQGTIETLQLLVKTLNRMLPTMYKMTKSLKMNEKESFILMNLLPLYAEKGIDVSFAPRGYLGGEDIVFIEDLCTKGFKKSDLKYADIEHCHRCLETLARFHMSSMVYETCKSRSLGKPYSLHNEFSEALIDRIFSGDNVDGAKYIEETIKGLVELARIDFGDAPDFIEFKKKILSFRPLDKRLFEVRTILHCDLRMKKFLHKYEGDKPIETKLIDYEMICYGPPSMDVLLFLYANTRKAFRDVHFQDLLLYYHKFLRELLQERGVYIDQLLPLETFLRNCEIIKTSIKFQVTIDRTITCIPKTNSTVPISDDIFRKFIYENRGRVQKGIYKKNSEYKDIILEELRELKDLLLARK